VVTIPVEALLPSSTGNPSVIVVGTDLVAHERKIEAGIRQGWDAIIGSAAAFVGMSGFGASAPYKDLYRHFGLTAEKIVEAALNKLWNSRTYDFV